MAMRTALAILACALALQAEAAPAKIAGNAPRASSVPMHGVSGERLYYQGYTPEANAEPWVSDGSAPGTLLLKDIRPGEVFGSAPSHFVPLGAMTYFFASDEQGTALWKTGGTPETTARVAAVPAQPFALSAAGNALYFFANDADGIAVWRSDGTAGGTVALKAFPRTGGAPPRGFGEGAGGRALFAIDDGVHGYELWVTDGTTGGTALLRDFSPGSTDSGITEFVSSGGKAYFVASYDISTGGQLWRSDGTAQGTFRLDAHGGVPATFGAVAVLGNTVYFPAHDFTGGDTELWRSDGAPSTTQRVKDLCPASCSSSPTQLVAAGNLLFFVANDATLAPELWRSDGTAAGTYPLTDRPGPGLPPRFLTAAGARLYFVMTDDEARETLWASDGTIAGTTLRADVPQGPGARTFEWLAGTARGLFFSTLRADFGYDLWYDEVCGAGDTDGDGAPDCVEVAERMNPAVRDNDIFASARLFSMQQYRDFLGREGDSGGIAFWADQLAGGGMSRAEAVQTFFDSPEFQARGAPVARLYFAYFLRIPDYGGLDYWIARYRTGDSLEGISNAFANSPEFTSRYGALDNSGFVDRVYRNVLGRAPDSGGLAFWKGQLDAGMSRGRMMLAFSESEEYGGLIRHEVLVTMLYVGMLRRAPDPGGFSFWVSYLDAANPPLALIQRFLDAPEYRGRFLP